MRCAVCAATVAIGASATQRDDVEVVRREILHDADVAHAFGEGSDPLGRDEEHVAELARQHALAQRDQRRVEALDVPDRRSHPGALARNHDLLAVLDGGRERLLDQHVDAGLGELQRDRQVLLRRQRDDGHVERALGEQLVERAVDEGRVADGVVAVAERVDGAGEGDAGQGLEDAGVVAAHHAEPEGRCAQHSAHFIGVCGTPGRAMLPRERPVV